MQPRLIILTLLPLLSACADAPAPAVEASTVEVSTYLFESGAPAEVAVELGDTWQVLACSDGVCADISSRVVSDGGWLVGPVDQDPLRYVQSPGLDLPSGIHVDGAGIQVTITRPQ